MTTISTAFPDVTAAFDKEKDLFAEVTPLDTADYDWESSSYSKAEEAYEEAEYEDLKLHLKFPNLFEAPEPTWLYELRTAARQLCFVAMAVSEKSFELHEWLATKLDK